MDWLKGMNSVIEYIEENLTQPMQYESLSRIVGCSVYEFSRIFSFMTGMSVSEYIRRRRLSQAVFDIQNGNEKIIDIALKYCYESPTTFARAFKELHGTTPLSARKMNISLKTYPPITFVLTIKGVNGMNFRIEKRDSFQIMGLSGHETGETIEVKPGVSLTPLWNEFLNNGYDSRFWNNGDSYYTPPFWQVGAYNFKSENGKTKTIIGAEYKGKKTEGVIVETIPAATWVVFSINTTTGFDSYNHAYTRIMTEWFPQSQYKRNEDVPSLDVYPPGDVNSKDYTWEIWMPVKNK
jgi:AraC family transcriptional regulator